MPQINYRANLSSAQFPLSVSNIGRSVIIPGPDNNYDRRVDPTGSQADVGIPQAIYMENVIPTASGYQSVAYSTTDSIDVTTSTVSVVEQFFLLNITSQKVLPITFLGYANGVIKHSLPGEGVAAWANVIFSGSAPTGRITKISYAVCKDIGYVLLKWQVGPSPTTIATHLYTVALQGQTCTLTNISASVTPNTIFGVTGSVVLDITAAYNYLCYITELAFVHSSTTTPTDFVPSLVSGAGSSAPNNAAYRLQKLIQHPEGAIIFTSSNAIFVKYTGNARYPWKFIPIANSGSYSGIYGAFNDGTCLVAETTGAIKSIDGSATATSLAPEVSTYLERMREFDIYEPLTGLFTKVPAATDRSLAKIYYFLSRYVLVSCDTVAGAQASNIRYESVLVFDTLLNRYGKLRVPHTHIVRGDITSPGFTAYDAQIAFINVNAGGTYTATFKSLGSTIDVAPATLDASILILGKFQYARSRFLCLDEYVIDGMQPYSVGRNFSSRILTSLDGTNFNAVHVPYVKSVNGRFAEYNCRAEGKNLAIVLQGIFDVNTVEMVMHLGGQL